MTTIDRVTRTFTITDEHLELLQHTWWDWCGDEFGAASIDPKRPYGSGDVYEDMAEILNIPIREDDDEYGYDADEYLPEDRDYMRKLHEDLTTVLEICCRLQKFETGTYKQYMYQRWERVE